MKRNVCLFILLCCLHEAALLTKAASRGESSAYMLNVSGTLSAIDPDANTCTLTVNPQDAETHGPTLTLQFRDGVAFRAVQQRFAIGDKITVLFDPHDKQEELIYPHSVNPYENPMSYDPQATHPFPAKKDIVRGQDVSFCRWENWGQVRKLLI